MSHKRITISMKADESTAKQRIFNPLDGVSISSSEGRMESLSRIENNDAGVCPKCNKPMGTATIANDDTVYYCDADRVSTPMPNL